jgi:hypothetical protein
VIHTTAHVQNYERAHTTSIRRQLVHQGLLKLVVTEGSRDDAVGVRKGLGLEVVHSHEARCVQASPISAHALGWRWSPESSATDTMLRQPVQVRLAQLGTTRPRFRGSRLAVRTRPDTRQNNKTTAAHHAQPHITKLTRRTFTTHALASMSAKPTAHDLLVKIEYRCDKRQPPPQPRLNHLQISLQTDLICALCVHG